MGGYHYTNAEEPSAIFFNSNTSANNSLNIGGGSATLNAATIITFYTGETTTTTTGTSRMNIQSDGEIRIPVDFSTGAAGALSFGAGQDAEMGYDGTDLIINPKVVGSGILSVLGEVKATGYQSSDGTAGMTDTRNFTDEGGSAHAVTIKNGLITGWVVTPP
jgi:hypothetical protein